MNDKRPYRKLLVDGYSLLHRDPEFRDLLENGLAVARELLIEKVGRMASACADRTTIVFDGRQRSKESPRHPDVEVIFSPAHQTADTVIERLVSEAEDPAGILVVTSDRLERETVTAAGAHAMSCANFLEMQSDALARIRRAMKSGHASARPTLGDLFPSSS
jgi:predicted RNA-binding protein with PIN domain